MSDKPATSSKDTVGALAAIVIFILALIGMCFLCGAGLTVIGWFTLA